MKRLLSAERIACAVLLAAATGAWLTARRFPADAGAPSGPQTFPLFLSAALAFLSLLQLARPEARPDTPSVEQVPLDLRRLLLLGGSAAAYLLALPLAGFICATAVFGAALLRILGLRHFTRALAAGFLFAFALYLVFERLMNVALPKGWIG